MPIRLNLMNELQFPVKVFVYGTLKRGKQTMASWFGRAANSYARQRPPNCADRNPPTLPVRQSCSDGYQVEGEIFEIPVPQGLDMIDTLEGNGSFYQRPRRLHRTGFTQGTHRGFIIGRWMEKPGEAFQSWGILRESGLS